MVRPPMSNTTMIRHLAVNISTAAMLLMLSLTAVAAPGLDLQGHRGARGLAPENTLQAFATALSIGVSTLEMDVGISADGELVVIHDRYLNPEIARDSEGRWLAGDTPAVSRLTLRQIQQYDVGRIDPASRYAQRFSQQQAIDGARIPTLAQVVTLVERAGNQTVRFNIETKLSPLEPELSPTPERFAKRLVNELRQLGISERSTIQSFDWRTLREVQMLAPRIPTVYLSAEQSWLDNIQRDSNASPWTAGFQASAFDGSVPRMVHAAGGRVWSPYFREIDAETLALAHELGLQVVVWTVDDPQDIARMIDLGVDGIISDYPDRLRTVAASRGIALPDATPVQP